MLRKKILVAGAIVALSAFAFTACEGPAGPAGPQGPAGENLLRVTSNLDIFTTGNTAGDVAGAVPPGVEITVVGTTLLFNSLDYIPFDASRTFTPRFYIANTGTQVPAFALTITPPAANLPGRHGTANEMAFRIPLLPGDPVITVGVPNPDEVIVSPPTFAGEDSITIIMTAGVRRAIDIIPADPTMRGPDAAGDWFGVATPFSHGTITMAYALPYGGAASRTHEIHFIRPRRFVDPPTLMAGQHFFAIGAGVSITGLGQGLQNINIAGPGEPPDNRSIARFGWVAPLNATSWDIELPTIIGVTPPAEAARAGRFDAYHVYTGPAVEENGTFVAPQAMTRITTGLGWAAVGSFVPAANGVVTNAAGTPITGAALPVVTVDLIDPEVLGTGNHFVSIAARGVNHQVAGPDGSTTQGIWRQLTHNSGRSTAVGVTVTPQISAPVITLEGSTISWEAVDGATSYIVIRGDVYDDADRRPVGNTWVLANVLAAAAVNGTFTVDLLGPGAPPAITFPTPILPGNPQGTLNVGDNSIAVIAVPANDQPFAQLGNPLNWARRSQESNAVVYRFRM